MNVINPDWNPGYSIHILPVGWNLVYVGIEPELNHGCKCIQIDAYCTLNKNAILYLVTLITQSVDKQATHVLCNNLLIDTEVR